MRKIALSLAIAVLMLVGASLGASAQSVSYSYHCDYWGCSYAGSYDPFPLLATPPAVYPTVLYTANTNYGSFVRVNSPCSYTGWLAYGTWGC